MANENELDAAQAAFVLRLLRVLAEHDAHDEVWWRTDGEYAPVSFFVNCNDVFSWGCADCEQITPENIGVLERAFSEADAAKPVVGKCWGGMLFCARVRAMRPQGCCYPKDRELWPLFDACGEKRPVDIGNPHKHPEDGGEYAYMEPGK